MKVLMIGIVLSSLSAAFAQQAQARAATPDEQRLFQELERQSIETEKRHAVATPFTNCTEDGSEGNPDGYQTETEYYKCDQGVIAIKGKWGKTIQDGWIYDYTLGRLDRREDQRVTPWDMRFFKWCPAPNNRLELCGLNDDAGEIAPKSSLRGGKQ